ncbi:MAG: hypothetical protein U0640_12580 [Phycisphaerales bacterium]
MSAQNTKPRYFTKARIIWFVASVAVWLFAILIPIEWVHKSGNQIELSHGQVCVTHWINKDYVPELGLHRTDRPSRSVLWLHDYAHTQYLQLLAIPLWPLALMPAIPMGITWFRSKRAASRLKSGFCPRCGYNRSGLPAEAPCPECNHSRPA